MIPGITAQASTGISLYTPADFMADSPTALYSLRLLNPSYGGSCLKVRRSTDDTTSDIGFSGDVLDEVALLAFVGAGSGYVDTWYDQSTNANHAVQPTTAQQPRIVNAGVVDTFDGYAAIYFDYGGLNNVTFYDATDKLLLPPFTFYNSAQTIIYTAEVDASCAGYFPAITSTQFSSRLGCGIGSNGMPSSQRIAVDDDTHWDVLAKDRYGQWFTQSWTTQFGRSTTTGWIDLLSCYNGADSGRNITTGFGTGAPSTSRLGGKSFRGHMRDCIVYPSALSTQARKSLEADLCFNVDEAFRQAYNSPSAAYGVTGLKSVCSLRKVIPEYTGPCIMVRREDNDTYADIGFDGSGDLDTTALLAIGGATVSVVKWYDQSQQGNAWMLRGSATGPLIVESSAVNLLAGVGTKPAIRLAGATRSFTSGYSPQGGPWTFIATVNPTDSGYKSLYGLALSSSAMSFGFNNANPPALVLMRNGISDNNNGVTVALNTKHVVGFRNSSSFVSGSMTATPILDGPDRTNLTLAGYGTGRLQFSRLGSSTANSDTFGGRISEVVVADSALSSLNGYAVQNSMGSYYDITIT